MTDLLTRRRFVAWGVVALGALAAPARALGKKRPATHTVSVFRLDPRSERCGHPDGACKTCRHYDKNFLFPTSKAANGNRAHKGCNCCIQAGSLDYGTYVALFGNPKKLKRYRADKRTARVNAVLKNHPAVFT
jgi:hypothetical protein